MALGAAVGTPALGAGTRPSAPTLALFDGEIEDGRRFAAQAAAAGHIVQDTGRDLAPLLYGERRDWGRDPHSMLIGVTRYADFQIASGIAREQGHSVIAALAREKEDQACRLIAGSSTGLLSYTDRLLGDFGVATMVALLSETGSVAWICA